MHPHQAQFIAYLKTKGTGPTMSKSLTAEDFPELNRLFLSPDVCLTTKATLLTALLTLPATPEEAHWISELTQKNLPSDLYCLLPDTPADSSFIQTIHSIMAHQDLTQAHCQACMEQLFDPTLPEFLKAAFLEGERLKRETLLENEAFWAYLWKHAQHHPIDLPFVIDLSNGYDGFNRTPYLTPFTAALLGASGFPCILHGMDEISPKNGINPFKLLKACGKNPLSLTIAHKSLKTVGWGYADQSLTFPALFALKPLRFHMVKRPFIATLEKLLQPFQAHKNYLITSYTHPPYKEMLQTLLKQTKKWDKTVILRGAEGSIQLSLDRRTPVLGDADSESGYVSPNDFHLTPHLLEQGPITVETSLESGLEALKGRNGYAKDAVIYQGAVILTYLGLLEHSQAFVLLQKTIASGAALRAWNDGMTP